MRSMQGRMFAAVALVALVACGKEKQPEAAPAAAPVASPVVSSPPSATTDRPRRRGGRSQDGRHPGQQRRQRPVD